MTKFNVRIKELREERGLTQKAVAEKLGVERVTINCWENRGSEPNYEMLVRIAALFDVSTDYLLGIEN